jgi:diaminopimelate epimerase
MVYKMKLEDAGKVDLEGVPSGGISFTKLHGNGNDFILIDELRCELVPEPLKSLFALRCCHRNLGIGGDGVLFLTGAKRADVGMRLFQPDGSEAEMCGNGIRCLAKYSWDSGYVADSFHVETPAGIIPIQVREKEGIFWAKVDMGVPRFERSLIPAKGSGDFILEKVGNLLVSAVNTGVPHAVVFVEDLKIPIRKMAMPIRHSPLFPKGTNVNFVKAGSPLEIRTFERGVEGETFACGTGAVASAAVARRLSMVGDEVQVESRGGPLIISFQGERAYMEGPAVTVYSGELNPNYRWNLS